MMPSEREPGTIDRIVASMPPRLKRFCLWTVDGALRYSEPCRIIRRFGRREWNILEVGSGSMGLTLFLHRRITGYDVQHDGHDLGLVTPVKAEPGSLHMPFGDGEFDFVLCMDMLEHVSPQDRPAVVSELVRVSRSWVVASLPCGDHARQADQECFEWCKRKFGIEYRWFAEHIQQGLPDAGEIEQLFRAAVAGDGRKWQMSVLDKCNIRAWSWAWRFQMSRSRAVQAIKNRMLWALMPYLRRRNASPAYRKLFVLHII